MARKKPVERISASSSVGYRARRVDGVGIPAEELGGHHVDPRVGALGREDGRDQQLIGVGVDQGADRLGVLALQRLHDPAGVGLCRSGPRIVSSWPCPPSLSVENPTRPGAGPARPRRDGLSIAHRKTTMHSTVVAEPIYSRASAPIRPDLCRDDRPRDRSRSSACYSQRSSPRSVKRLSSDLVAPSGPSRTPADGRMETWIFIRNFVISPGSAGSSRCRTSCCFPHVILPLHIFEPRYRQMTQDALDGDQLVTIVQACPADKENPWVEPVPIAHVACLGKIIQHERLPDGRFNMLLLGCKRVRLVRECRARSSTAGRGRASWRTRSRPTPASPGRAELVGALPRGPADASSARSGPIPRCSIRTSRSVS